MIVFGVMFLVCLVSFVVGAWAAPDHTIRGAPAVLTFGGMVVSGVVLAAGAL